MVQPIYIYIYMYIYIYYVYLEVFINKLKRGLTFDQIQLRQWLCMTQPSMARTLFGSTWNKQTPDSLDAHIISHDPCDTFPINASINSNNNSTFIHVFQCKKSGC